LRISWGGILCWLVFPAAVIALLVRWLLLVAKGIGGEDCFRDCVSDAQLEVAMWMFFAAVLAACVVIGWRYWPRAETRRGRDEWHE
jgi:hypothetical protein